MKIINELAVRYYDSIFVGIISTANFSSNQSQIDLMLQFLEKTHKYCSEIVDIDDG